MQSRLRILITGSSGLVGSALCSLFKEQGHDVVPVKRECLTGFEGCDVFIHLAGESIADGFWTKKKKERIRESRVLGTQKIVEALSSLKNPPKLFICASGVGYYGDVQGAFVSEESPLGKGFLASVCSDWESASDPLRRKGVRVVNARFGYILSLKGGLLKALLPLFRLGLGGKMGDGRQYMPWVALEDVVRALSFAIENPSLEGPVNITSPKSVTQEVFAKLLAKQLKRPSFFAIPRVFLFGGKAKELVLPSLRVSPTKLEKAGFSFSYKDLELFFKEKL
jgi:uncharacterized protein (TIGR01777 family)